MARCIFCNLEIDIGNRVEIECECCGEKMYYNKIDNKLLPLEFKKYFLLK